jgi:alpha-amylase/alpha-mannosidase (GH57 family)
LRVIELELLNLVIPTYRARADAGQIEISTSPFYHPILPLLCDTDIYKRTHPESRLPRRRFMRPGDALAQLERAADYHERLFGKRPVGLWPSEGSVSDAMVPLVVDAGFKWMATDELILARTLGIGFGRDGNGVVDQADRLYRPYSIEVGGVEVACGFRDHGLSDRIGFVYSGWPSEAAAEDFTQRVVDAGRHAQSRGGGEEPTVFVILDGENAWEHFEGGGRPFLRALYHRLGSHAELRTVTMADACATPKERLSSIFPGSWIDANFSIWIGHPDDQLAWSQLADARDALDQAGASVDQDTRRRAQEEVFIAEGSDWCWWYGDDHSSDQDAEFDDLYRRHLRNVYRLLGRPIPDELFLSNISTTQTPSPVTAPTALISPAIDGEDSSYFEWLCAGTLDVREVAGAMHQIDRQALVAQLRFGFDASTLYLRVDGVAGGGRLTKDGSRVDVTFLRPAAVRVSVGVVANGQVGASLAKRVDDDWRPVAADGLRAADGEVLELAVPLAAFGDRRPAAVAFFVTLLDGQGAELERHPSGRPVELLVPDDGFEARNWSA